MPWLPCLYNGGNDDTALIFAGKITRVNSQKALAIVPAWFILRAMQVLAFIIYILSWPTTRSVLRPGDRETKK